MWDLIVSVLDRCLSFYLWFIPDKSILAILRQFQRLSVLLGNDVIHQIFTLGNYKLKVILTDWDGETRHAVYTTFKIANEADGYRLTIDGYSGDAGKLNAEGVFNTLNAYISILKVIVRIFVRSATWVNAQSKAQTRRLRRFGR